MKLFVKLMALAVVLALAGPFFLKGPDGQPLMKIADVTRTIKRQWHKLVVDTGRMTGNEHAGKVEVYRWQDENGNWHFSDEESARRDSERIEIDPYASRMDPFTVNTPSSQTPAQRKDPGISMPLPLTVSPAEAKQLIKDAEKVRDDMENRARTLEEKTR